MYGDVMPGMSEMDSRCSWCFGRGPGTEPVLDEEGSGAESLDSSSSSTAEKPAMKKAACLESVLEKCYEQHL